MLTKTKIVLAAALVVGAASVALADGGPVATQSAFQSAPAQLRRDSHMRTAPVRLQNQGTFNPPTQGAGHMPRAFMDQQQPGYPQSPPGP